MFLASTAAAMPRGAHISSKKVPKAVAASGTEDPKVLIISWRTEVRDVQPSSRTTPARRRENRCVPTVFRFTRIL